MVRAPHANPNTTTPINTQWSVSVVIAERAEGMTPLRHCGDIFFLKMVQNGKHVCVYVLLSCNVFRVTMTLHVIGRQWRAQGGGRGGRPPLWPNC